MTAWFGNLKVGAKITLALAVALLAGAIVAIAGLNGLSKANAAATTIHAGNLTPSATPSGW